MATEPQRMLQLSADSDQPESAAVRRRRWLGARDLRDHPLLKDEYVHPTEDPGSVCVANREWAEAQLRNRAVRAVTLPSGQLLTDLQDTLHVGQGPASRCWPGEREARSSWGTFWGGRP
jgi:hypothetical protein